MKLIFDTGGEGAFIALSGDRVELHATVPRAPGTPLAGVTHDGSRYEVKVRTSRKIADDPALYWVEGRLMNATRAARERLLRELAEP